MMGGLPLVGKAPEIANAEVSRDTLVQLTACVALLIDMSVAVLTNALSTMTKGLSPLN